MSRTIGAAVGAVILLLFFASLKTDATTTSFTPVPSPVSSRR